MRLIGLKTSTVQALGFQLGWRLPILYQDPRACDLLLPTRDEMASTLNVVTVDLRHDARRRFYPIYTLTGLDEVKLVRLHDETTGVPNLAVPMVILLQMLLPIK